MQSLDRAQLLKILTLAKNTAASNPIHPILGCFCFTGQDLVTFDGVRSTVIPFQTEFTGGIPSVLLSIISRYRGDIVQVEGTGSHLNLKCGRSKDQLVLMPAESFLWSPSEDENPLEIPLSLDMQGALKTLLICADKNPLHTNTNGIYLVKKKRSLYFAASDSNVIGVRRMSSLRLSVDDFCILIPYGFIELLAHLDFEHEIILLMEENRITCVDTDEGIELSTRLVKFSNMPDCLTHVNSAEPFQDTVVPDNFAMALERATCLDKNVTKPVTFVLEQDSMTLRAKSELGVVEESFEIEGSHHGSYVFNGMDLQPLFKSLDILTMAFCQVGDVASLLLKTGDSEDAFRFLICCVKA